MEEEDEGGAHTLQVKSNTLFRYAELKPTFKAMSLFTSQVSYQTTIFLNAFFLFQLEQDPLRELHSVEPIEDLQTLVKNAMRLHSNQMEKEENRY